MEAIVLAGGLGNRLRSVVADLPKPMADIAGRPFLEYLLDYLISQGVTRIILGVSYRHELIEAHFGTRFRGAEIRYSVESERRGTGGAIDQALTLAEESNVLALNGDTLFAADLRRLMATHLEQRAVLTVALRVMSDCGRYGAVQLDTAGRITGFLEKQAAAGGLINGGIYCVNREWYRALTLPHVFSFEQDVMEGLHKTHSFAGVPFDCYFIDIGIPEDYHRAVRELPQLAFRS